MVVGAFLSHGSVLAMALGAERGKVVEEMERW